MKFVDIEVKKRGKVHTGKLALPDSIQEAVSALGEPVVLEILSEGLLERFKKALTRRQTRWVRIDRTKLSYEQAQALSDVLKKLNLTS